MQSQNRFFDDFSKVVNGAVGTLAGVGREAEAAMRERVREFIGGADFVSRDERSEEHTSELQSLMRISYAVFCLKKKNTTYRHTHTYGTRTGETRTHTKEQ